MAVIETHFQRTIPALNKHSFPSHRVFYTGHNALSYGRLNCSTELAPYFSRVLLLLNSKVGKTQISLQLQILSFSQELNGGDTGNGKSERDLRNSVEERQFSPPVKIQSSLLGLIMRRPLELSGALFLGGSVNHGFKQSPSTGLTRRPEDTNGHTYRGSE